MMKNIFLSSYRFAQELKELPLRSGVTVRSAHSDGSLDLLNSRAEQTSSGQKATITPSSEAAITP